jgi:hypothetical protein
MPNWFETTDQVQQKRGACTLMCFSLQLWSFGFPMFRHSFLKRGSFHTAFREFDLDEKRAEVVNYSALAQ